jgi:hypothetical protein
MNQHTEFEAPDPKAAAKDMPIISTWIFDHVGFGSDGHDFANIDIIYSPKTDSGKLFRGKIM